MLKQLLYISAGGAMGALSRFLIVNVVSKTNISGFPYGVFLANVLGSFCIGFLAYFVLQGSKANDLIQYLLIIGFLGAFTTFSSYSLDTMHLLMDHRVGLALMNVFLNNAVCLVVVWLGFRLAESW